jgi:arylsulfatase A-like enzyme
LYEEQIHVPLVFRFPQPIAARQIDERVSSIDVMPTILDLLDVAVPEAARKQMRGFSLTPAMIGKSIRRDVFSETDYRQYTYKRSIITPEGWKLIYTCESKHRELYDLNADPREQTNRAGDQPRCVEELEQKLFAHFRSIGHDLSKRDWKTGMNPVYQSQDKEAGRK